MTCGGFIATIACTVRFKQAGPYGPFCCNCHFAFLLKVQFSKFNFVADSRVRAPTPPSLTSFPAHTGKSFLQATKATQKHATHIATPFFCLLGTFFTMFAYEDVLGQVAEWRDPSSSSRKGGRQQQKQRPHHKEPMADGSGSRRASGDGGSAAPTTPRPPQRGGVSTALVVSSSSRPSTSTLPPIHQQQQQRTPRRNNIPLRQVEPRAVQPPPPPRQPRDSDMFEEKAPYTASGGSSPRISHCIPAKHRFSYAAKRRKEEEAAGPLVLRSSTVERLATPRRPATTSNSNGLSVGGGGGGATQDNEEGGEGSGNGEEGVGNNNSPPHLRRSESFKRMEREMAERQQRAKAKPGTIPFRNGGTSNVGWFKHLPTPPALTAIRQEMEERRQRSGADNGATAAEDEEKLIARLYRWPTRPAEKTAPPRPPLTEEEEAALVDRLYVVKNNDDDDGNDGYEEGSDVYEDGEADAVDIDEQVDRLYYRAVEGRRAAEERRRAEAARAVADLQMRGVREAHQQHPHRRGVKDGGGQEGKEEEEEEERAVIGAAEGIRRTVDRLYDTAYYERRTERAFARAGYMV